MRGFAYRITQVIVDVVIALVFVRPYIDLKTSAGDGGKMIEIILTSGMFLIPVISIISMTFFKKGQKAGPKLRSNVILCALLTSLEVYCKITGNMQPKWVAGMMVIATIIELFTIKEIAGKKLQLTPSILNIILDIVLAIISWEYLLTEAQQIPDWCKPLIVAAIVILAIVQFATTKDAAKDQIKLKVVWAMVAIVPTYLGYYKTGNSLLAVIISVVACATIFTVAIASIKGAAKESAKKEE